MVKLVDSPGGNFIQKCDSCGDEHTLYFSALNMSASNNRIMPLPICSGCNSYEFLILNYGSGNHDMKVTQVFSEVTAAQ